ncbi:HTTM domain-containing protein [Streptomyces sp. NPDC005438]|uniref:HTTM domain-containing protein n=1 Tax=Streptomyces sp. NPDC005438 TaxID=3156880 RepID=UPI0033AC93AA
MTSTPTPREPSTPQEPATARRTLHTTRQRADQAFNRGLATVTSRSLGPYQTAVVRIGFAFTWLVFLLREWPHRHELYGPDGPWDFALGEQLVSNNQAFTALLWTDSTSWFELVYLLALASSVTLALGWRTRTSSLLFMIGVLSLQNRSVFMGDGGDNVIHLMAMYLVLTRCAQVWSLDARRARREQRPQQQPPAQDITGVVLWSVLGLLLALVTGASQLGLGWALFFWGMWAVHGLWWAVNRRGVGEPRQLCDILAHIGHNGTLLVIMAQVCFIYATAGWYKIQGSRWQDGTASYYPMHLDYFAPFPVLGETLVSSSLIVLGMTYVTVIIQVAFPFTVFHRRIKNVLLTVMIAEHLSIAVLMGLPFFSLAMIAADAVFLPENFLRWTGARVNGLRRRLLPGRRDRADDHPDPHSPEEVPLPVN